MDILKDIRVWPDATFQQGEATYPEATDETAINKRIDAYGAAFRRLYRLVADVPSAPNEPTG